MRYQTALRSEAAILAGAAEILLEMSMTIRIVRLGTDRAKGEGPVLETHGRPRSRTKSSIIALLKNAIQLDQRPISSRPISITFDFRKAALGLSE